LRSLAKCLPGSLKQRKSSIKKKKELDQE